MDGKFICGKALMVADHFTFDVCKWGHRVSILPPLIIGQFSLLYRLLIWRPLWQHIQKAMFSLLKRASTRKAPPITPSNDSDHFLAVLAPGSSLLTPKGYVVIEDATRNKENIVVWSGSEWVMAHIVQGRKTHRLYRVITNNGLEVVCGRRQSWPLLSADEKLRMATTNSLESGQRLFPFMLPPTDSALTNDVDQAIAAIGGKMGHRALRGHAVDTAYIRKLSLSKFRDFMIGWIKEQGGHIRGGHDSIRTLHFRFHELGCGPCQSVVMSDKIEELYLVRDGAEKLGILDAPVMLHSVMSQIMPPTVLSVAKLARGLVYYVAINSDRVYTLLVNGVLVLAPQSEKSGERSFDRADAHLYDLETVNSSCSSTASSPGSSHIMSEGVEAEA